MVGCGIRARVAERQAESQLGTRSRAGLRIVEMHLKLDLNCPHAAMNLG